MITSNNSVDPIPPYTVPLPNRIYRAIFRPVFRGIFHLISRVSISGLEFVPQSGPYLIASNHISIFEPPFVLSFWPKTSETVAAAEVWSRTGQSTLVRLYRAIPVHRGLLDREMLEAVLNVLKSGRPLYINPEGGRSHVPGLKRALPGVAFIADLAKVPVVPVGIVGSTEDFFARGIRGERPPIEMHIGQAVLLPSIEGSGKERRLARQRNADEIMEHIAALLPYEYRGAYAA